MAFTMAELRQELHALGYGALPDDVIASSLSQLDLDVPLQSRNNDDMGGDKYGSSSSRRVRFAGKSSRVVHGSPVPGDREFAVSRKSTGQKKDKSRSTIVKNGGLDSVCFTPDFATELDEMRKMLNVMQGTKEELFGSGSGSSNQKTVREPMGLAGEHKHYVGNLLDRWRVVGRTIRSKRKEFVAADVAVLPKICDSVAVSNSETSGGPQPEEHHASSNNSDNSMHRQKQYELSLQNGTQLVAERTSTSKELGRSDDGCDLQTEDATLAEVHESNRSAEDESLVGNVETDNYRHHQEEGAAEGDFIGTDLNEGDVNGELNGLNGGRAGAVGVIGIDTGYVFKRQESSSAISPGVSYQPGGMLYPEHFTMDTYQQSDLSRNEEFLVPSLQDAEDHPLHSRQDVEENLFSPSPRSSSAQLSIAVLDNLSALSKDQFLAAFQRSLDDMDPKDIIDQETFANVNQKISDTISHTHISVRHHISQDPIESENPLDLGVPVLVRTSDRTGGGDARHQSPLNDRSNMRFAEDQMVKKAELNSAKALKRTSTVMLKRSRSSRVVPRRNEIVEGAADTHLSSMVEGSSQVNSHLLGENTVKTPPSSTRKLKSERVLRHSNPATVSRRHEIVEEANDTHISDVVEGGSAVDSYLLVENITTPPSSARKLRSERVPRLSKSAEKSISTSRSFRHNRTGSALDGTDLDIHTLGLSPIKIQEQPASPHLSTRERSCVANGYSEHRQGSHCSACHPPSNTVRKRGENDSQSSATGSRSPVGKHLSETALSETEASPRQKHPAVVRKENAAGSRSGSLSQQKLASKKSASAAPSGIYTPLADPKKNDLNSISKVLLKTRRLASSMDFACDSSRLSERRAPSLRSSTESSRSSGPQRAPSAQSQVSKSNSVSPYAKSSSFGSFSSRGATPIATSKDMLSSPFGKTPSFTSYGSRSSATTKDTLTPGGPRRGGKVDRVARFAEMQNLWKNDKFLKTSSKRKPQSFHRIFARLHLSHERCTAAYRERVIEDMRPTSDPPPFVVPTSLYNNAEGVCTF